MSTAIAEKTVASLSLAELEDLIRRVVREELVRAREEEDVVYLDDDSPLYRDLLEIRALKERGEIRVLSREEAFGDHG